MANGKTSNLRRATPLPHIGAEIARKAGLEGVDLGGNMSGLPSFAIDRPSSLRHHTPPIMTAIGPIVVYIPNDGRILADSGATTPRVTLSCHVDLVADAAAPQSEFNGLVVCTRGNMSPNVADTA